MPAPKRVSDELVKATIQAWGGNVTAAAEVLDMQPKNLRERCLTLGIDLDALRSKRVGPAETTGPHRPLSIQAARIGYRHDAGPLRGTGEQSKADLYPLVDAPATFSSVKAEAQIETRQKPPITIVHKRQAPIRLTPAQHKVLREGVYELQATLKQDTTESAILSDFFDERFGQWLMDKLIEAARQAQEDKE